jgi:ribosomal protein L40E
MPAQPARDRAARPTRKGEPVFCTRCGQQNPEDAEFCARCGTPLLRPGGPVPEGGTDVTATSSLSGLGTGITVGSEPEPEATDDTDAAAGLPEGAALLVVRRGPNAGSRFLLDAPTTTAGRHPDSDIFLDDVTVSRRHAEFRRSDEGVVSVRDVGSLNGTYVNRERIDAVDLTGGDEVQIGKFRLVYLLATGPAGAGSV